MQKIDEVITRTKEILSRMDSSRKYLVAYHFDVDGCCSASLLWRYFQKENIQAEFFPMSYGFEPILIEKISVHAPDEVILLDYTPGRDIRQKMQEYNVTIIDHHVHEKELESFNYFTSQAHGTSVSVSYFLSEALHSIGFEDIEWLGKLGAFWDKAIEDTKYFKKGIYKRDMDTMIPFNMMVSLSNVQGARHLFKMLNESKSMEDAIEKVRSSQEYIKAKDIFDSELKYILSTKDKRRGLNLVFYNISTELKHMRIYVDVISYTSKDTTVFINNESNQFKFSLRTPLEIDLENIVKTMKSENPDFTGGGHKKACGAKLVGHNIEWFMERFMELYKQQFEKLKEKSI